MDLYGCKSLIQSALNKVTTVLEAMVITDTTTINNDNDATIKSPQMDTYIHVAVTKLSQQLQEISDIEKLYLI